MKVYMLQPPYSKNLSESDRLFDEKIRMLEQCNESVDLIVLPEYSDVPCAVTTREEAVFYHEKYIDILLKKCRETAKRCNAVVCVNALYPVGKNYRNTTYVYDRNANLTGTYFKRHLPPSEQNVLQIDSDYTKEFSEPYVLELDGIRYGFLTCYDFYFYEAFAEIARKNVDIIIGCSLQRSDSHDAIETMCKFLAYQTNAYVVRSSVSFDEHSDVCGASMAVAPDGHVLVNMKGKFGIAEAEFDPKKKYLKPAGFGNLPAPHHEYIEWGRKPWYYRPGGSAVVPGETEMPYPRICAHRGFSTIAPENSMPAYGAAVAMGAEEIEFDIWPTADGELVSIHNRTLERVSTGCGDVTEYTLKELQQFDFGRKFDTKFKGLHILKFEEILRKFSSQVILNIHVKPLSYVSEYPEDILKKIVALVKQYNCEKHAYFMLETDVQIQQFKKYAPEIPICVGHLSDRPLEIVDRAIQFGCEKVQLFKPYYNQEMIDKAHANGIRCNMFWSDDQEETKQFLNMGIDTILTNDYLLISQCIKS